MIKEDLVMATIFAFLPLFSSKRLVINMLLVEAAGVGLQWLTDSK